MHGASTFLQAYVPPVYMTEDDVDHDAISSLPGSSMDSDEDSDSDLELPPQLLDSAEYKQLQALREMRQIKLANANLEHDGYKVRAFTWKQYKEMYVHVHKTWTFSTPTTPKLGHKYTCPSVLVGRNICLSLFAIHPMTRILNSRGLHRHRNF